VFDDPAISMLFSTHLIHFADVVFSSKQDEIYRRKWNAKHAPPVIEKSVNPISKAGCDSPVEIDTNDNDR